MMHGMHDAHDVALFDPAVLARARSIAISGVVGRRLKLQRQGRGLFAPCPFHNDKTPSFHVHDAKGFAHCFGCGWHGDAISFVMKDQSKTFVEAVEYLTSEEFKKAKRITPRAAVPADQTWSDDDVQRSISAYAIWCEADADPLLERYLRARRITLPVPPSLRLHPDLRHSGGHCGPALVAGIQAADRKVIAVQRTWLRPDGDDRLRSIDPGKMTLGPMMAGAVRLARAGRTLGIAEGVETALSAMQIFSLPVWASCGAGRMASIGLPDEVEHVVIFADQGEAGEKAAEKAREQYEQQGLEVSIEAPEGAKDWNAVLMQQRPGGHT